MLAQGQSSSAKRGGLAVVSSGLIFLKKKKKKKKIWQKRTPRSSRKWAWKGAAHGIPHVPQDASPWTLVILFLLPVHFSHSKSPFIAPIFLAAPSSPSPTLTLCPFLRPPPLCTYFPFLLGASTDPAWSLLCCLSPTWWNGELGSCLPPILLQPPAEKFAQVDLQ